MDKCLEHMSENGDQAGKIIIKGDQERPMAYLLEQIVEMREEGRKALMESSVQSKGTDVRIRWEISGLGPMSKFRSKLRTL